MDLFVLIFLLIIGIIFIIVGLIIWKNNNISLIHDYHHTKVSEKDKKTYTKNYGKALLIMGTGICLTGIIDFMFNTAIGFIIFGVCFICGLVIIIYTQIKYNHGIF